MARSGKTDIIGVIAIIVGVMLVLGGLMFLLVTLMQNAPPAMHIPPFVQIALGLAGVVAGFFLRRGNERAGGLLVVLLLLAIAVIANVMLLAFLFVTSMR